MWMKQVPHSTFSDFDGKSAGFKHPATTKQDFVDIPNYRLTSSRFDAQHLDRFIVRVNESDSVGFMSQDVLIQDGRTSLQQQQDYCPTDRDLQNPEAADDETVVVMQKSYNTLGSLGGGAKKSAFSAAEKNQLLKRASQQPVSQGYSQIYASSDKAMSRNPANRATVASKSANFQNGQLTGANKRQSDTSQAYGAFTSQRYQSQRSRGAVQGSDAYTSLGTSKFDTLSSRTVRPSTSFMNVSRKHAIARHTQMPKTLFNPMTDQMTSIIGHNETVLDQTYRTQAKQYASKQQNLGLKSCFAKELKQLDEIAVQEKSLLDQLTMRVKPQRQGAMPAQTMGSNAGKLTMPSERRKEVALAKKQMQEYVEQKEKKMFIKRRAKLIRSHWRNGIAGVENAQDCKAAKDESVLVPTDPLKVQSYFNRFDNRKEQLRALNGASDQFNFFTSPQTVRKATDRQGQNVVPMNQTWNTKARVTNVISKQGSNHTHENLFQTGYKNQNPLRVQNLIQGETKGRNFNPVTGTMHFNLEVTQKQPKGPL